MSINDDREGTAGAVWDSTRKEDQPTNKTNLELIKKEATTKERASLLAVRSSTKKRSMQHVKKTQGEYKGGTT
eukprot:10381614-Ditylum_brightwellii.AAC.2